jgi:hypothetical protein
MQPPSSLVGVICSTQQPLDLAFVPGLEKAAIAVFVQTWPVLEFASLVVAIKPGGVDQWGQ